MNNSFFDQVKRLSTPQRNGIVLFGFVLFALVFFLEYTYSNKHGDLLGSILYAIPFSCVLAASLLSFTNTNNEISQSHMPWHKRQQILIGLILLFISFTYLVLLINSLMNNNLPDVVSLPIEGICFLLILLFFVQFVVVRRSVDSFRRD